MHYMYIFYICIYTVPFVTSITIGFDLTILQINKKNYISILETFRQRKQNKIN